MGIKMMHHVCIQTENYGESLEFYTKILGFEVVQEIKNFHNRDFNTWLKIGTFMIELQTNKKEDTLNNWNELNEFQDKEYEMVKWKYDMVKNLIIHRL